MKATGHYQSLPIDDPESLVDLEIDAPPAPQGRELLVEVKAVSVNPVDTKRRMAGLKPGELKILGYDAAGVVKATGPQASLFKPGDEVYYAGSIRRQGTNSELHLVDERIVGTKPSSLSFAQAAALPLTTITAWEAMFERMGISKIGAHAGKRLLILGGAGGVGSIAIQLAKKLARLHVTASASRPESIAWVRKLGADATVDHTQSLPEQLGGEADYIFICTSTDPLFPVLPKLARPQGRICSIVRTLKPVDLAPLQEKSLTFAWEGMFTRSSFETEDLQAQHELLEATGRHVDAGTLVTTFKENLGRICAQNLKAAHRRLEQGHTLGKLVLEGF
jgi:zinc-binding alcohol dehydrogenase family protein